MQGKNVLVDTLRQDPVIGFHFSLEIMGTITGYFTEISGLGSETEPVEHKVVNPQGIEVTMKIPGRLKWEDITVKRGITSNMDLWNWRKLVEDGNVKGARKNGSVSMFDQSLLLLAKWDFLNAWPVKITGPQPKSDSNEVGVEELVITHEGITRVI